MGWGGYTPSLARSAREDAPPGGRGGQERTRRGVEAPSAGSSGWSMPTRGPPGNAGR